MTVDDVSKAEIERIIDRRLNDRLAALADDEAPLSGSSKRSFLSLLAGGAVGYGASTFSGANGPPAVGQSEENDEGAAESAGAAVVTTADELESALEEEAAIRVRGSIDVTDIAPVEIPESTVVYGKGTYRYQLDMVGGDGLRAAVDEPVVDLAGNDSVIFGIAVVNTDAAGDGISVTGFSNRVSHTDVFAGRYGIDCRPNETTTEPRLNFNRVVSTTGSDATSVGIRIENMHDAKIINNIVAGFEIAIDVLQSSAIVSLNHTYTFPADSTRIGIRVTEPNVRVINNRIEGSLTDAGVAIRANRRSIVAHNLVQVGEWADGIELDTGESLIDTFVTENLLQGPDEGTAATAVSEYEIDSFWRSVIGPNTSDNFDTEGLTAVSEAPGSDESPSEDRYFTHQIVENRDDGSVWIKTGDGMVQLG